MGFIFVYVTYPSEEEARKIILHLLNKKLIACANLFPIKSIYKWKEEIKDEEETVSILKTRKTNWDPLRFEIKKIHSYDVPCITKIETTANSAFEKWIANSTYF